MSHSRRQAKKLTMGDGVTALTSHPAVLRLRRLIEDSGFQLDLTTAGSELAGGQVLLQMRLVEVSPFESDGSLLPLEEFCFYLAHEARHVEHIKLGLFSSYYDCSYDIALLDGFFGPPSLALFDAVPDQKLGLAAERDCDRFAVSFVRKYLDEKFNAPDAVQPSQVRGFDKAQAKKSDQKLGLVAPARQLESHFKRLEKRLKNFIQWQKNHNDRISPRVERCERPKSSEEVLSDDTGGTFIFASPSSQKNKEWGKVARTTLSVEAAPALLLELALLKSQLSSLQARCGKKSLIRSFCTAVSFHLQALTQSLEVAGRGDTIALNVGELNASVAGESQAKWCVNRQRKDTCAYS